MKKLSIISTCFNEEDNIENCYKIIKEIMNKNNIAYEHIFTDNNSQDGSIKILEKICESDKNIKVLVNNKNYGPFLNNFNALKYAKNEFIIVNYAVDMQDPPEMIIKMFEKIQDGYDVVYAKKTNTKEGFIIKNLWRFYYFLLHNSSDTYYPMNVNEFMCAKNEIIQDITKSNDYFPYVRGYIARATDNFFEIEFERRKRTSGKSKNKLIDLYSQGINGLIFTMDKSIRIVGLSFIVLSLISLIFLAYTVFAKIAFPSSAPKGITILISLVTLFFSLTSGILSLILEYVLAIHNQIRGNLGIKIKKKINL